jgi:uncharacterized protein YfiM (DUF2279 family)
MRRVTPDTCTDRRNSVGSGDYLNQLKRAAAVAAVAFIGHACLAETVGAQIPADTAGPRPDSVDTASVNLRQRVGLSAPADTADSASQSAAATACGLPRNEVATRRAGVAVTFVGGNAALYSYFKRAWWSGEKADHFFFRADWDQDFRDQDKFGHAFGGYHLARIGNALLRSTCISKNHAILWSAAYAAAFQVQIEVWDGMYKKYGFSYADVIANTTGTALALLHETHPATRAFKPTISYSRSAAMRNADNIPGELRPSLDYSGQTYWLSADVNALLPAEGKPFWPSFLRVSVGHSITDWIDPKTGANMRAKRRILLSLDLDAEKLPGDNRFWKTFKRQLGYIHLPSPALQISPTTELIGWYR